jgi:hypothetical protein
MRQSIEHDMYTTRLILNGSCVNLGSFDDVRNREISASEPIFFELSIHNPNNFEGVIRYQLESENDGMSLHIPEVIINQRSFSKNPNFPKEEKKHCLRYLGKELYQLVVDNSATSRLFRLVKLAPHYFLVTGNETQPIPLILDETPNLAYTEEYNDGETDFGYFNFNSDSRKDRDNLNLERIHFVSADRIGPQEFYHQNAMLPQFPHVGTRGEFAVNLLDKMGQELVKDVLCLGEDSRTLMVQTEAWLGTILNPLKLEVRPLTKTMLELVIGGSKPANVGFGYSSVLPIIVSGLIAKPGEKLIIENPEIHLHPKSQSALIQFLVAVANTGVQVFVESHSDHVLNGIRVAVKEGQIDKNEVAISFHDCIGPTKKDLKVTSIKLDSQGELSEYPTRFFDEYSNQLFKLV